MNARTWQMIGLLMLMPAAAAVAQEAPKVQNEPSAAAQREASPVETVVMPMDRIESPVLLDTQLEAMRGAVPGFNCVVVRDPGVAGDYPILPAMSLKKVTVGQFLEFIEQSFSGVQVRGIDGPQGALYAIRIQPDNDAVARALEVRESSRVRLYRLADVIHALADDKNPPGPYEVREAPGPGGAVDVPATRPSREARIKEATSEVLSLVQAALETVEDNKEPYSVKIHEPTLTLLFKGSPEQKAVLQDALATLYPQGRWAPSSSSLSPMSDYEIGRNARAVRYGWGSRASPSFSEAAAAAEQATPPATAYGSSLTPSESDLKRSADELAVMRNELARRMSEIKAMKEQLARPAATKPAKE